MSHLPLPDVLALPFSRLLLVLLSLFCLQSPLAGEEPLISLKLPGRLVEGTPLKFNEQQVFFLARDGQLVEFAPGEAKDFSVVAGGFKSYSQAQLRGQLQREFGAGYEVTGVGHYLVVHPAGQGQQWAPRFEELYRSFVHYFSARGWQVAEPRFPLVAVVYPRQVDFMRQARREGVAASGGLLGYYSPTTNRILLYDATAGRANRDWSINAETVIHEAAHQVAFNTGIHTRFASEPRWVVEGIGMLFESRGVWQSRQFPHQPDRVNRVQLSEYRRYAASRRKAGAIAELISSDRAFSADTSGAYAEAWALSFFLIESEPKKYFQYLAKTAAAKPFSDYRGPERLKDFTDVFGADLRMFDARMQRFLASLN